MPPSSSAFPARRQSARLVRPHAPRPAVARRARRAGGPLSRLALGNPAAADDDRRRRALLPRVPAPLARGRRARRRAARRGDERLRRPRLLFARAQPARLRQAVAAAGGAFPSDEAALRALPGIGPYTAAAVAAIAFDRPATPIDGNIARIVSRLAGFRRADRRQSPRHRGLRAKR